METRQLIDELKDYIFTKPNDVNDFYQIHHKDMDVMIVNNRIHFYKPCNLKAEKEYKISTKERLEILDKTFKTWNSHLYLLTEKEYQEYQELKRRFESE